MSGGTSSGPQARSGRRYSCPAERPWWRAPRAPSGISIQTGPGGNRWGKRGQEEAGDQPSSVWEGGPRSRWGQGGRCQPDSGSLSLGAWTFFSRGVHPPRETQGRSVPAERGETRRCSGRWGGLQRECEPVLKPGFPSPAPWPCPRAPSLGTAVIPRSHLAPLETSSDTALKHLRSGEEVLSAGRAGEQGCSSTRCAPCRPLSWASAYRAFAQEPERFPLSRRLRLQLPP